MPCGTSKEHRSLVIFKPCLGLLEEEGLRGSAHQCCQHFDEQNGLGRLKKLNPVFILGLKVTTLLLFRKAIWYSHDTLRCPVEYLIICVEKYSIVFYIQNCCVEKYSIVFIFTIVALKNTRLYINSKILCWKIIDRIKVCCLAWV